MEGNLPAPRSGSRTRASSRWILDDRPIRARRHRFQRENNEICSIIGRQFIVAEWFLLRLTTAGTEGATRHSKEDNLPWGDGPFFSSPFRATQPQPQPSDPRLVLPPIVRIYFLSADLSSPFFFTSLPRELRRDFSCSASFSTLPALISPSLFRHPRIFVVPIFGFGFDLARLSAPRPSSFHLTCGARSVGRGRG